MLSRPGPRSLARLIAERASSTPGHVAIATLDESITYAGLADLSVQFARHMRRRGIGAGMRVAIIPDHPIVAVGLILACSLLGCAWIAATADVMANPGLGIAHLLHAGAPPAGLGVPCHRVDASWSRPPAGARARGTFDGGTFDGGGFAGGAFADHADPARIWMIARSSGTTGEAKLIGLSEAAFHYRVTENNYISDSDQPVYLALFPLLAYTGTLAMLRTLAAGGTFLYADPRALFGRTRIDVIHGSPAHLQRFMDATPAGGARVRLARMGGGVAGPGLFRRLLTYFDGVMHVYGSTEAATTATRIVTARDIGEQTPGVGRVVAGATVEIVDAAGTRLAAGTEGIVRVRTPSQASGYLGDAALSAEVFRDGWFHPGDLGVLSAEGELRITGRANDQLNIGGTKLNPVLIDAVVQDMAWVRDGACFAWRDADGVAVVAVAACLSAPVDIAAASVTLRDAVAARVGRSAAPRALFVLDGIPRNANGKIARLELPAAVAALAPVAIARA